MAKIIKELQAVQAQMQKRIEEAREKLRRTSVIGSAGGGLIEVKMNGERELISVSVKPEIFAALGVTGAQEQLDEKKLSEVAQELSDLIFSGLSSALYQAEKLNEEIMSSITPPGGMTLPGIGDILKGLK